jgi:ribonuclease HI
MKVLVVSDSKYVINSITKGWVFGWEKRDTQVKKSRFMAAVP